MLFASMIPGEILEVYAKTVAIFKPAHEGPQSTTRIYALSQSTKDTVWIVNDYGEKHEFTTTSVETVKRGCCGATDSHAIYSLENGRRIITFDPSYGMKSSFLTLLGAEQDRRFISYISMAAGVDPYDIYIEPSMGLITYSSATEVFSEYIVYNTKLMDLHDGPVMMLISADGVLHSQQIDLSDQGGATPEEIFDDVVLTLDYDTDWGILELPIQADQLAIQNLQWPEHLKIEKITDIKYLFNGDYADLKDASTRELRLLRDPLRGRRW